jgi:hypothetical protein
VPCPRSEVLRCAALLSPNTCFQYKCGGQRDLARPLDEPARWIYSCLSVRQPVGSLCRNDSVCINSGTCTETGGCDPVPSGQLECLLTPVAEKQPRPGQCSCHKNGKKEECLYLSPDGELFAGNQAIPYCSAKTGPPF